MDRKKRPRGATGEVCPSPTGFRRMTPGLLKADRTAEKFTGLPEGVAVAGQLLAAFKAAAPRLGISPRLVHAVDWLFRFTQPQDWEQGAGRSSGRRPRCSRRRSACRRRRSRKSTGA